MHSFPEIAVGKTKQFPITHSTIGIPSLRGYAEAVSEIRSLVVLLRIEY
jgi:hypothetical protein